MKKKRIPATPKTQLKKLLRESNGYVGLIGLYREKVLTQKTRTIRLLGRKNSSKIIHTLLGYEVQACYKRIQCPDLVTARYLRLFSELGCHSIKLPYDPTLTEKLIPDLESALEGINEKIREIFPGDYLIRQRVTQGIYAIIRREVAAS